MHVTVVRALCQPTQYSASSFLAFGLQLTSNFFKQHQGTSNATAGTSLPKSGFVPLVRSGKGSRRQATVCWGF